MYEFTDDVDEDVNDEIETLSETNTMLSMTKAIVIGSSCRHRIILRHYKYHFVIKGANSSCFHCGHVNICTDGIKNRHAWLY